MDFVGQELTSDRFGDVAGKIGAGKDLSAGSYGRYTVEDTGRGTRIIREKSAQQLEQEAFDRSRNQYNQAIAPSIKSLEEGIPETQGIFGGVRDRLEAQRTPLNQRYETLLEQIRGNQESSVNSAQMTTSRELGRRGIPLSSTLADQEISGVVDPLLKEFSNILSLTGIQQSADNLNLDNLIADTADSETQAIRAIRNAIANTQSQAGMSSISTALQMLQNAEAQRQFDITSAMQKEQLAQNMLGGREIKEVNGRMVVVDKYTGQVVSDLGPAKAATTGTGALNLGTTPAPAGTATTPAAFEEKTWLELQAEKFNANDRGAQIMSQFIAPSTALGINNINLSGLNKGKNSYFTGGF